MVSANLCFIGTLVVFALCIEFGFSLECYECNSATDTRCNLDILPGEFKKKCDEKTSDGKPYILCRKIKQMIDFEVNGLPADKRVIRTCGWDDSSHKNKCYQRSGFGGRQEVCACESDTCNGTGAAWASGVLIAAGSLALTLRRLLH